MAMGNGLAVRPGAVSAGGDLGTTGLERLLRCAADVVLLLDASDGTLIRRWHDPEHSRLRLPVLPPDRTISWIHPDDITDVLRVVARVAREGGTRTIVARVHPDHRDAIGRTLLVTVHDVQDVVVNGILIQAWLADFDAVAPVDAGTDTAMSSLGAAAPVGLQVRSGNGSVSFENQRFTDLAAPLRSEIDGHLESGMTGPGERIIDVQDDARSLRLRIVPTVDPSGELIVAVASLEDVTSLRRAEEGRAAAEGLFRAVFDDSPVPTAVISLDGYFAQVNESFTVVCGYSVDELVGRHCEMILHPDDADLDRTLLEETIAGTRSSYQIEKRIINASGHEVWVDLTVAPVRGLDGTVQHLVVHAEDVTARKASLDPAEAGGDLAHWATHDHLTGLPNRRYLDNFLANVMGQGRRAGDRCTVLFVDLDDFKPVNDTHGHGVGDDVLRTVARRLRNTCRDGTVVARYGGDEFVLVARGLRSVHDLSLLVDRILSAVRTPIHGVASLPIRIAASVGIATASAGDRPDAVLARADAAAYQAKAEGKDRACYAG